MDIYQNNPALFKDTGFSCTFKSIKEREKYALDYYSRVQKCFFMGNWITEYTKNKISAECVCVGAGANTKLINSRRKRENKDFNFLFIGRDFERKNGPLVVSAFNILHKKFKNTKLTIWGPQSIKTEYQVGVELLYLEISLLVNWMMFMSNQTVL